MIAAVLGGGAPAAAAGRSITANAITGETRAIARPRCKLRRRRRANRYRVIVASTERRANLASTGGAVGAGLARGPDRRWAHDSRRVRPDIRPSEQFDAPAAPGTPRALRH